MSRPRDQLQLGVLWVGVLYDHVGSKLGLDRLKVYSLPGDIAPPVPGPHLTGRYGPWLVTDLRTPNRLFEAYPQEDPKVPVIVQLGTKQEDSIAKRHTVGWRFAQRFMRRRVGVEVGHGAFDSYRYR